MVRAFRIDGASLREGGQIVTHPAGGAARPDPHFSASAGGSGNEFRTLQARQP
jgi:hypothetical protein